MTRDGKRLVQCISGGASTACSVIDAALKEDGELYGLIDPVLVIADRPCKGLDRCVEVGRLRRDQVVLVDRKNFTSADEHAQAIVSLCKRFNGELAGLHGYLRLAPPRMIDFFNGKIINQHPGPLPGFGGKHMHGPVVHESVMEYHWETGGEFMHTEATVHWVNDHYDEGDLVAISRMPILENHTPELLADDLLPREHALVKYVYGCLATHVPLSVVRETPPIPAHRVALLEEIKTRVIERHRQNKH